MKTNTILKIIAIALGIATITLFFINPKFKVEFNSNNGEEIVVIEIEKGNKITKPKDPVKEGYNFTGWLKSGNIYNFDEEVTENIKLEASWGEIKKEEKPKKKK